MHQNAAGYLAGLAPLKNHCTSARLTLLWGLHLSGLCVVSKCRAAFSRVVLHICPRCSSACVVATASPITSPSLRACQHWNGAGFPAAFQPTQCFEGVREPVSSMCLPPCQLKPWGRGRLSACLWHSHLCTGLAHPHGSCRHGLYLQENKVTPCPGHMIYPLIKALLYIHSQTVCLLPFSLSLQFNAPARVIDRVCTRIFALKACFSNALENTFFHLCLITRTST